MHYFDRNHYLETPNGLIAQYRQRAIRRIRFSIDDVEPRQKRSMPEKDKDAVQQQLLRWLIDLRRLQHTR